MIERHPDIQDNIIELERHETIGDTARAYGDDLAGMYEDLNLIVMPHFPLDIDMELFQALSFPSALGKVGSHHGLDQDIFRRKGRNFEVDTEHVLMRGIRDLNQAGYIRGQIAAANAQIKESIRALFPMYYSLNCMNLTWRFSLTENEDLHFDTFRDGAPVPARFRAHRIKFFINLDSEPRQWWTSHILPETLKVGRDVLPDRLPNDINQVNYVINQAGPLAGGPHHKIHYPTFTAVFGNGEAVSHAIIYGRRMVAGEFECATGDMLDPGKSTHGQLPNWLEEAGIGVGPET